MWIFIRALSFPFLWWWFHVGFLIMMPADHPQAWISSILCRSLRASPASDIEIKSLLMVKNIGTWPLFIDLNFWANHPHSIMGHLISSLSSNRWLLKKYNKDKEKVNYWMALAVQSKLLLGFETCLVMLELIRLTRSLNPGPHLVNQTQGLRILCISSGWWSYKSLSKYLLCKVWNILLFIYYAVLSAMDGLKGPFHAVSKCKYWCRYSIIHMNINSSGSYDSMFLNLQLP